MPEWTFIDCLTVFAGIHCAGMVFATLEVIIGNYVIDNLKDVQLIEDSEYPSVDIVISALNEAETIRPALQTLLKLDYPNYRLIAINDRSTDQTGEILNQLAKDNKQLQVIHIETLPKDWLGKTNAMQTGADFGCGDIILFTDADIHFERSSLKKAVSYFMQNSVDHLSVFPHEVSRKFPYILFFNPFILSFSFFSHPWFVGIKQLPCYVGIGAFNLIRRSVFKAIEGYHPIKMRPDDDVKLGKLVKSSGYKQAVLFGKDMVQIEWYGSLKQMYQGMMKNAFSGINYNILMATFAPMALIMGFSFPLVGLLIGLFLKLKWLTAFYSITLLSIFIAGVSVSRSHGISLLGAFTLPVTMIWMPIIIWSSMVKNLKDSGIYWRNTFYPLSELKRNNY